MTGEELVSPEGERERHVSGDQQKPKPAPQRVRGIVRLMRHSGLSIRDTVTLERKELLKELLKDEKTNFYRVRTARQKTGTHVSVVLPADLGEELVNVPNDNPKYFFWNTGTGKPQSDVRP
jgi:integrase/recombinase XerD